MIHLQGTYTSMYVYQTIAIIHTSINVSQIQHTYAPRMEQLPIRMHYYVHTDFGLH